MERGNSIISRVDRLVSGYGDKIILHGISIGIEQGKISTLIGRNGVGKTTLLNTVMGILKPSSGQIFFHENDVTGTKPHILASMGISYVPQGKCIFPYMTVEEHLDIGAWLMKEKHGKDSLRDRVYTLFPRLRERKSQKAGTLSGGERQMLSISRALMLQPTLLLLDEPSFGLAPILVNAVFKSIVEINKENVTVFLVEQSAKKALENSDTGYVMDMGKITYKGSSKELLQNEEVRLSYLGGNRTRET